jgi:CheY-like chemotaxis protein
MSHLEKTHKPNLTILLAEDDPDDQELIKEAFSDADVSFVLQIVKDGKSVIRYLETTPDKKLPCLIVLDYNMPELNGAEVLQHLYDQPRYKHIPKVILSTSSNQFYVQEALKKGAYAYKVKPSNYPKLVEIAKEMIALCSKAA